MSATAIRLGNKLIDAVEAMEKDIAPRIMNKDLDLIEEAIDENDLASLRLFQTFLGFDWRPEEQYVPLNDLQGIMDGLHDRKVASPESFITEDALDAYHAVSSRLVRLGHRKWKDAALLAVLRPDDASLICALVIDRGIHSWESLQRVLTALKRLTPEVESPVDRAAS